VTLDDGQDTTVATMTNLPPGSYVVFAHTTVVERHSLGHDEEVTRCTLDAGGTSTDYAETDAGLGELVGTTRATLHLNVLTSFSGTGTIVLRCRSDRHNDSREDDDDGDGHGHHSNASLARQTKIIALELDTVSRLAVGE
jgi:hypothetical protein